MKVFAIALIALAAIPVRVDAQARGASQPQGATPGVLVQPPVAVAAVPPPPTVGPLRNIRFEIVISDSGISKPTTKKVSLIVATGREGQIRSSAQETRADTTSTRNVPLNVDIVRPVLLENGGVSVAVVVDYQPDSPGTVAVPARVQARFDAVLTSGRKMLISETADPASDRTTTVEVTATVLP